MLLEDGEPKLEAEFVGIPDRPGGLRGCPLFRSSSPGKWLVSSKVSVSRKSVSGDPTSNTVTPMDAARPFRFTRDRTYPLFS